MSQTDAILAYLKTGKPLTPIGALTAPGIRSFRLGARIKELRDRGHNITTTIVQRGNARVAEYRLK